MNISIGGYFELETTMKEKYLHHKLLALNTARNSFEYILRARHYKHIFVPYFTCDVLLEPIEKLGLSYSFYDIDDNLEPIFDYSKIKSTEAFLVTNYFGLKGRYINFLSQRVSNIIVDNAQALFELPQEGIDTFYSPRKFVGVADGGYVSTTGKPELELVKDKSYKRMTYLLKRIDLGAEAAYQDFKENDASLRYQSIKSMSHLTQKILAGIDYIHIAKIRRNNYEYLHENLKNDNLLQLELDIDAVPMVYPFRTKYAKQIREKLLSEKIFCAIYWPNVYNWCNGKCNALRLTDEIIAFPIDQRFSIKDMKMILKNV